MHHNLAQWLESHEICHGVGDKESACTVASINLALTGEVTDDRPDCMCPVLHSFVIPLQDAMPLHRLNTPRWRAITIALAGSKADAKTERRRVEVIMDWLWVTILPSSQHIADKLGFGAEWRHMITERTEKATKAVLVLAKAAWAEKAADAEKASDAAKAAWAERAAWAATKAANAAWETDAAKAADSAWAAADSVWAAKAAWAAARAADAEKAADSAWGEIAPEALMEQLLEFGEA